MAVLVGGSVALDTIETPHGRAEKVLGGSASYFAYAASFLTSVSMVGIVGPDFPDDFRKVLESQKIDLTGLEISESPTFSWHGRYHENMNIRDTLEVNLSIFENYVLKVPNSLKQSSLVCLANMSPQNQLEMLDACEQSRFVIADTMNLWIEMARPELLEVLKRIDLLVLNDSEAQMLTEKDNLIQAGQDLLKLGPQYVCLKKGEHGAALFSNDDYFVLGAYPLTEVKDPTGAGDCFAGGMAGYLDQSDEIDFSTIKKSLLAATTAASFCVEDYSFKQLEKIDFSQFQNRLKKFQEHVSF